MAIILRIIWEVGDAIRVIIQTVLGLLLYPFVSLVEWVTNRASSGQLFNTQFSTAVMMILFFIAFGSVLLLIRYSYRIAIGVGLLSFFNPYVIGSIACFIIGLFLIGKLRRKMFYVPFFTKKQR